MEKGDNVYAFPAKATHGNPNVELLTQPEAYALVQLVDGEILTSYNANNLLELLGLIELLRQHALAAGADTE